MTLSIKGLFAPFRITILITATICHFGVRHYAECRIFYCNVECRNAECHYAECRYAECSYAECRSAIYPPPLVSQVETFYLLFRAGY